VECHFQLQHVQKQFGSHPVRGTPCHVPADIGVHNPEDLSAEPHGHEDDRRDVETAQLAALEGRIDEVAYG
jgi:hypothetical protein